MGTPQNFAELVSKLIELLNLAVPLIFALTIIYISWKVIDTWILHAGDQQRVEDGKKIVLVSVIALVFMVGVWGFVRILQFSFFGS